MQDPFQICIFYLMASRSRPIYGVATGLRWTTTASPADALYLDQYRLMNNPGQIIIIVFSGSDEKLLMAPATGKGKNYPLTRHTMPRIC